jgi:hypothetical protein
MIPYFSLEMLRALLELCGGRTPGTEDPYPAPSNHVKTHATARARIRPSAGGRFRPESSANEGASRLNIWPGTAYYLTSLSDKHRSAMTHH